MSLTHANSAKIAVPDLLNSEFQATHAQQPIKIVSRLNVKNRSETVDECNINNH